MEQTVVGYNFKELVQGNTKDVLLVHYNGEESEDSKAVLKEWDSWASNGEENWLFAKMDYSLNAVEHIAIHSFPTVLLFPGKDKGTWFIYDGDFNQKEVFEWAKKKIDGHKVNFEL